MLAILNTTDSLTAVLAAAAATTNPSYSVKWREIGGGASISNPVGALTDDTALTLVAAPTAGQRVIDSVDIYNRDTAAVTVTLFKVVSGTSYTLHKVTLQAGDHMHADALGLITINTAGNEPVTDSFAYGDAVDLGFGDSTDTIMRWSTGDASDHSFVIGLGDTSQMFHITDKAAVASDWNITSPTHPTLYIHSNTTPITDYLAIGGHTGTAASINLVGGATLNLAIDGTAAVSMTATVLASVVNDTVALGSTTLGWSDLHLGSGGVINWANGEITLTAAADTLTMAGGDYLQANGTGMVIGHTAQVTASAASEFQVLGTALADGSAVIGVWAASAVGPELNFVKSRNAAIGSFTIAQDNDEVGKLVWLPDDGVDYATEAMVMVGEVDDGSPAAGDVGMALVLKKMPGGGLPLEEQLRVDAAGSLILNQQAQDVVHLVLRSSDVVTGATTIVKGGTVTTNDYFTIAKQAATTGGAYLQAIGESTNVTPLMFDAWGGAPATTDTSGSLAAANFFVGQHDNANADADMAADSNAFAWGEIDAANARLTRMLLKADDGELHLGNATLVALDNEDDVMLVRAMQRTTSQDRGVVESMYDHPFAMDKNYDRLRELKLVGEKDKEGFYLFPLQPRLALHEGALWQLFVDLMEVVGALPDEVKQKLPERLRTKLLPA